MKRCITLFFRILGLAIFLWPAVVSAALELPAQARVLQGWELPDGRHMAGLELRLKPGWKTYWRAPGDAGIPPRFDWSPSDNIRTVEAKFPTPQVHIKNGLRTIGYSDRVVFPLIITPTKDGAMHLRGRIDLGLCSDICIPHSLAVDMPLSRTKNTRNPDIAAAMAALPYSAQEANVRKVNCDIRASSNGLILEVRAILPRTVSTQTAIIEPDVENVWVGPADISRSGDWLVVASEIIHNTGAPFMIDRSRVVTTILTSGHAIELQGCNATGT